MYSERAAPGRRSRVHSQPMGPPGQRFKQPEQGSAGTLCRVAMH